MKKNHVWSLILVLAPVVIGLSQYIGSQIYISSQEINEYYFQEKKKSFEILSDEVINTMLKMTFHIPGDSMNSNLYRLKIYKPFKESYYKVRLSLQPDEDTLDMKLLSLLERYDGEISGFYINYKARTPAQRVKVTNNAKKYVNEIIETMRKILVQEKEGSDLWDSWVAKF